MVKNGVVLLSILRGKKKILVKYHKFSKQLRNWYFSQLFFDSTASDSNPIQNSSITLLENFAKGKAAVVHPYI